MVEPVKIQGIYFEEGKLWKPRYPSLIDYDFAPDGFQFEPAFRARSTEEVEVRFQIAEDQPVVFATKDDGTADWQPLAPLTENAVEVAAEPGRKLCRVVWNRDKSGPIASLRIVCRHLLGGPESDEGALDLVEGGVYLTIINSRDVSTPGPAQKEAGAPVAGTIRLLGIDEHHRPVYDLFKKNAAPPELELEPAIRAAHGERLEPRIALDLPESYAGVRFETTDGQVDMLYWVPDEKPAHLIGTPADDKHLECRVEWYRPPYTNIEGKTASFYARLIDNRGNTVLCVDPTVIEPPACDASGVCTLPRPPLPPGGGSGGG